MREKKVFPLSGGVTTAHRFAVLGTENRFIQRKHAWKVWKALKEFGCTVYPVAPDLKRLDGASVFAELADLTGKIDVVVPCLRAEAIPEIIAQAKGSGAKTVWFQEGNWTPEFQTQGVEAGIQILRSCLLKHKVYPKPFGYFNPCFWHGLQSEKVPGRKL